MRLSLLSRDELIALPFGGYRPAGYLFVATRPEHVAALEDCIALQHRCGLAESRLVDRDEVLALNPALAPAGIVGGSFCPTDGFVDPMGLLEGYLDGSGAKVLFGSGSPGDADIVVNTKGAWAGELVTPLKRQVAVTEPFDGLPVEMPMTVFCEDGFHVRVRDGCVLLLRAHDTAPGYATDFEEPWLDDVVRVARARLPVLADARVDRDACYAGLYEMSPDGHALLGVLDGEHVAIGSSGHGVMHAPALGRLLAEMITHGEARSLDASALRPERFAEGRPIPSTPLL